MDRENWDAVAQDYQRVFKAGIGEYNRQLIDYIADKAKLAPGSRVLDVGCGVGKYGACLAALGCELCLTDISPKMLEHARENMKPFSSPWQTLCGDFHELDLTKEPFAGGFRLSISTMSPAISSQEDIKRLSSISSYCFLTGFDSWEQPLRDSIYQALGAEKAGAMEGYGEAMLAVLRQAGYEPEHRVVPYGWTDRRSPAEQAEYMLRRHPQLDEGDSELMKKSEEIIRGFAEEDGLVTDRVDTLVSWIWWKGDRNI